MTVSRVIRTLPPWGLLKTMATPFFWIMGGSATFLWLLGVVLGVDPTPIVSRYLVDASLASAPLIACCIVFWLTYLPIYSLVVWRRSVLCLSTLRDEGIRPTDIPNFHPIPFYSSEKWSLLICWLRLHLSQWLCTAQDTPNSISGAWSPGTHPQIE